MFWLGGCFGFIETENSVPYLCRIKQFTNKSKVQRFDILAIVRKVLKIGKISVQLTCMFGTQARQSTVIHTTIMDTYQAIKPPEKKIVLNLKLIHIVGYILCKS